MTKVRADDLVHVYSNDPKHIRKLRADTRAREVEGGEDWARFEIPSDAFDPLTGFKRRVNLSDEQRDALRERLARVRADAATG